MKRVVLQSFSILALYYIIFTALLANYLQLLEPSSQNRSEGETKLFLILDSIFLASAIEQFWLFHQLTVPAQVFFTASKAIDFESIVKW